MLNDLNPKGKTPLELLYSKVQHFHAAAGNKKATSEAKIGIQTGNATIELDNSIA